MSYDMRSWKQRSLEVASRSTTALRGQLAQRDLKINRRELQPGERGYAAGNPSQKQSWGQWVGEKVAATIGQGGDPNLGVDEITMFPGWAARRYVQPGEGDIESSSFGIEVFISGYASNRRPPEAATRSQRAFMRLAKGFAALPKLQAAGVAGDRPPHISTSTENLLDGIKLPPRPTEITEDYEIKQVEEMEEQFRHLDTEDTSESITTSAESDQDQYASSSPSMSSAMGAAAANISDDLRQMHHNLETRLRPFWSTALSSRAVNLSLFCPLPATSTSSPTEYNSEIHSAIASTSVITGSDGSFQATFHVPWADICTHPGALHIAFGDPSYEYELLVTAQMVPKDYTQMRAQCRQQHQRVPLSHSPMRVISDIDDTVKLSNIVSGARAVFRNVFVKEMRDVVIPGMGEWYNEMWRRGVRFHYVSNGPFELIPVLNEFFEVSHLPPGSIRLKSYAGRSFFNGLLSAPATRKRAGILDILDNFPESRFVLIGDSGEQDLELYAVLARERPEQIKAVFIRDVLALEGVEGVRDPTGSELRIGDEVGETGLARAVALELKTPVARGGIADPSLPSNPPFADRERPQQMKKSISELATTHRPRPVRTFSKISIRTGDLGSGTNPSANSANGYFTSSPSPSRQGSLEVGAYPLEYMTEQERKRFDLQMRIYRARAQMPRNVALRIFRRPEECVEAGQLLDRLLVGR